MTGNLAELLTPEQVAQILGVTVKTLAQWRFHKRYPLVYRKIGANLVRYARVDVQAFIKSLDVHCAADTKRPRKQVQK
jgi:hypothetical protein